MYSRQNIKPGLLYRRRTIIVACLLALAAMLLVSGNKLWMASAVAQDQTNAPLVPAATQGDQCVAETGLMRKNHMDMLNHQRDDTVINGVRGAPFSLVGCVNCHAQRDADNKPVRIDAEGQFCESCHAFVSVKIDCFSCHAAVPDETAGLIGYLESQSLRHKQAPLETQPMISSSTTRKLPGLHLVDAHEQR